MPSAIRSSAVFFANCECTSYGWYSSSSTNCCISNSVVVLQFVYIFTFYVLLIESLKSRFTTTYYVPGPLNSALKLP